MAQELTSQIRRALRLIFHEGAARPAARAVGAADPLIYTVSSLETHIQRAVAAFDSLPADVRPSTLAAWRPDHTRRMVRAWREGGLATATVKNRLSSLRKLALALNTIGGSVAPPAVLVPDDLYLELRRSVARAGYSDAEVERILARLAAHPRGGAAAVRFARLIWRSGLRPQEALGLREDDLDHAGGTARGTSASDVRRRRVDLADDPAGQAALRATLRDLPRGSPWLWLERPHLAHEVEEAVRAICAAEGIAPQGLRGLRAAFAAGYLRRRLAAGVDEDEARAALARLLGHRRHLDTYHDVARLTPQPPQRQRLETV